MRQFSSVMLNAEPHGWKSQMSLLSHWPMDILTAVELSKLESNHIKVKTSSNYSRCWKCSLLLHMHSWHLHKKFTFTSVSSFWEIQKTLLLLLFFSCQDLMYKLVALRFPVRKTVTWVDINSVYWPQATTNTSVPKHIFHSICR
jgi:hypothetical protein